MTVVRHLPAFIAAALAAMAANANDLKELYELAVTRDASLQAAGFQRDAAIESRPQALAQWLPQISANASAARERQGFDSGQLGNAEAADCALTAVAGMQHCYGTVHSLGVNLSQTLWSFQAFSQLKEANSAAAAAEAAYQGARQNLLLRVAQAYFGILSAADQLATNRGEREAFAQLLNQAQTREKTGVGPRSDVEQAQAFYDASVQGVIDAQNALDDANLALSEIVGAPIAAAAPLRADIPLTSPEPDSADEWVVAARRDNFAVRSAALKAEAAERDISAQRGRGLPTFALTGSSSKITQNEVLGGNESMDTVGVSFSWPLFQGGAVASAVRQSRALYAQAQAVYDSTQHSARQSRNWRPVREPGSALGRLRRITRPGST